MTPPKNKIEKPETKLLPAIHHFLKDKDLTPFPPINQKIQFLKKIFRRGLPVHPHQNLKDNL